LVDNILVFYFVASMERHKKKLEELKKSISTILDEVEHNALPRHEAANRIVEVREQMDALIKELKDSNLVEK
jgi:hypothetical protein